MSAAVHHVELAVVGGEGRFAFHGAGRTVGALCQVSPVVCRSHRLLSVPRAASHSLPPWTVIVGESGVSQFEGGASSPE